MGSTAGETDTPGHATTRPGVWLTDASLVLMATIWGVNFSVVKYGTILVDPLAYNGLRLSIAALVLVGVVVLGRMPWPNRRDTVALVGLGVLGNAVYQYFFVIGVALTRASDAALVIAATPAMIAIIGKLRGTDDVGKRGVAGIALSIFGIGFVVMGTTSDSSSGSSLKGDFLVLGGSLCWAIYTVYLRPYTQRIGGMQLSAVTMVGGAAALLVVAAPAVVHTSWSSFPFKGWLAVLYSAIGALVIAYYIFYRGVRIIGPTRTAMYSNLQPVIAVLVAWAMLGEQPTVWQGVGAGLIMAGLLLTRA
jgi:drug/metabolite transporter (DMT)-like permease